MSTFRKTRKVVVLYSNVVFPPPLFSQKPVQPKLEPKAKKAAKVRDPGPDPD